MQYLSIVENSYEEAVKKAKELYGDNIRIHSRRDFTTHGGLFTRKIHKCEITCYISDVPEKKESRAKSQDLVEFEKEARTPNPDNLSYSEKIDTEIHRHALSPQDECAKLLKENYITGPLKDRILSSVASEEDASSYIAKSLASCVPIDYESQVHPSPYMVFLGPTGCGKTTTLAKTAYLYAQQGKKVAIITLDSFRVGAYEQIKTFGDALSIPVDLVKEESEIVSKLESFSWYDLVLVDTMGLSNKDKDVALRLKGLTSRLNPSKTSYIFAASPSMKEEDLTEHYFRYKEYNPSALVCTKLDESETMGNMLSFAYKIDLPLLFLTDGQRVPEDIQFASSTAILPYLKGISFNKERSSTQLNSQM